MQIKIVNASSGIITNREMKVSEVKQYEEHQEMAAQKAISLAAKVEARTAAESKLLALGLTAEDLKALLG